MGNVLSDSTQTEIFDETTDTTGEKWECSRWRFLTVDVDITNTCTASIQVRNNGGNWTEIKSYTADGLYQIRNSFDEIRVVTSGMASTPRCIVNVQAYGDM